MPEKTTTEIRNMWSYLLQALDRSKITIDSYYQKAVQYELFYGMQNLDNGGKMFKKIIQRKNVSQQ